MYLFICPVLQRKYEMIDYSNITCLNPFNKVGMNRIKARFFVLYCLHCHASFLCNILGTIFKYKTNVIMS